MPKKYDLTRSRGQSRRAASKEALKQMQLLLDDEADTVEIPSDDDVISVDPPPPPKKKYKLSHRKSSDGHDRDVIVLKSITNRNVENTLELECWVESLDEVQLARLRKFREEEKELKEKLESLAAAGEIIHQNDSSTIIEVKDQVSNTMTSSAATPQLILNSSISQPHSYQLVVDPRLIMLGNAGSVPSTTTTNAASKAFSGKVQVAQGLQQTVSAPVVASPVRSPRPRGRPSLSSKTAAAVSAPKPVPVASKKNTYVPAAPPTTRARVPVNTFANVRPSENNVEGGLTTGNPVTAKKVVDLTTEDGRSIPDSREISFNKLQGKTYPSLVVVARPQLRVVSLGMDRSKLDAKVKSVLMHAPTKFTEWLIQQGLVRSEQKCTVHPSIGFKLGMYSDVSKFPYSGGYVWISECCPQRFVSVFSGSLFEGSPHPPMVILKLLYHWACQTNIQNVTQWVKIDNLYVKGMFTWLRAVCTVAIQSHVRLLGGPGIKVEVGVISLGTTSQDGNQRQVKVEVLGVLETNTKLIRLRAVEPLADGDRNYKKRFSKILEPIYHWVNPQSVLVTDLTVDKPTLVNMGFKNVVQSNSAEYGNNRQIMEYLRRIVPRMFQNTLSLLSRQIIQQFLDELVWREWFGTTTMQAFDNLVAHLSEQTRWDGSQNLINRLNKVAQNPFRQWGLPISSTASKTVEIPSTSAAPASTASAAQKKQRIRKPEASNTVKPTQVVGERPPKSNSPDFPEQMVPLENYYYGTIDNYVKSVKVQLNMKCPYCKVTFNNNIQLMNHLFQHAHSVTQDAQLCRYCLTSLATANDLLKHIATSHPSETKFDNGFVCVICETRYINPFILGKHMSKEHCPSELPYRCATCGFRCSNHKQAIDHFYKQHDNGTTIQCPFCLKSTTVLSSSRNLVQNLNFFVQHLQKHQKKQHAKRCGKCNLWFVQKEGLREHQSKMHVSQRGKSGLVPWSAPRNGVMVPKSKMDKYPGDGDGINFTTLFYNVSRTLKCKECNTPMDTPKHFPSFERCQNPNCQYSTCCSNAMQEHNAKCSKHQNSIAEEKLPYEMFCICGFSHLDGNQMAKHLAVCEKKSAYPSKEEAKKATVTHSMLDVLGLVRKPEEEKKSVEKDNTVVIDDEDVKLVGTFKVKGITNKPGKKCKDENIKISEKDKEKSEVDEDKNESPVILTDASEEVVESSRSNLIRTEPNENKGNNKIDDDKGNDVDNKDKDTEGENKETKDARREDHANTESVDNMEDINKKRNEETDKTELLKEKLCQEDKKDEEQLVKDTIPDIPVHLEVAAEQKIDNRKEDDDNKMNEVEDVVERKEDTSAGKNEKIHIIEDDIEKNDEKEDNKEDRFEINADKSGDEEKLKEIHDPVEKMDVDSVDAIAADVTEKNSEETDSKSQKDKTGSLVSDDLNAASAPTFTIEESEVMNID